MEYRKHFTSKIIRTEHRIVIWPEGSAGALKKAMENVPDTAKLVDIEEDGRRETLVFLEEKPEK